MKTSLKNMIYRFHCNESGFIFPLALILLLLGILLSIPLSNFMMTSLKSGILYEDNRNEFYAVDAGLENGLYMVSNYESIPVLSALDVGNSYSFTIDDINGETVNVRIDKVSALYGVVGDDEYKLGQPHEDWIDLQDPSGNITRVEGEYVEFSITINFDYEGNGSRSIEKIGAYFSPCPDVELIEGPYDSDGIPAINFNHFAGTETKVAQGGFCFEFIWENNKGPVFDKTHRTGTLLFKFRINDPAWDWQMKSNFVYAIVKEQDVSYIINCDMSKWLIESVAENTKMTSTVAAESGSISILIWDLNPPE